MAVNQTPGNQTSGSDPLAEKEAEALRIREFIDRCGVPSCKRQLNVGEFTLPPMLLGPPEDAAATESQSLGVAKTAVVNRSYRPQSLGFGLDEEPGSSPQRLVNKTIVAAGPPIGTRMPPGRCLDCGAKIPIGTFYCERHGGEASPDHWTDGAYGVRA